MKKKIWPETQVLLAIPVLVFLGIIAMLCYRFFTDFIRSEKPSPPVSHESAKRILSLYPEAKFKQPALVRGKRADWIVFLAETSKEQGKNPEDSIEVTPVQGTDDFLHLAKFNDKTYYLLLSGNSPKDVAFQCGDFVKWLLEEAKLPKATKSSMSRESKI